MTNKHNQLVGLINHLEKGIRRGELAFIFDVDKTLAQDRPGDHTSHAKKEELFELLSFLQGVTGGAVAINTGRPNLYLKTILPHFSGIKATENGSVIRRGDHTILYEQTPEDLAELRSFLEEELKTFIRKKLRSKKSESLHLERCYLEEGKEASLTVQFTDVADHDTAEEFGKELFSQVYAALKLSEFNEHYYMKNGTVPGNAYIEILQDKIDKGITMKRIMSDTNFQGKKPVFFGDSSPDEPAMQACIDMGGFAVGITESAPDIAKYRLDSYHDTLAVLKGLKARFEQKPLRLNL